MFRSVLLAAFALSACVQAGAADETVVTPDLSKMNWQLADVDGTATGWTATLDLSEPDKISGQAPCNRYFGPLARNGASFVPGKIATTRMACLHMQGEAEFLALLAGVTHAEEMPDALMLSGGGHLMRFVPLAE